MRCYGAGGLPRFQSTVARMTASTIPKMTPIRMVGLVSGMIFRLVADAKLRR